MIRPEQQWRGRKVASWKGGGGEEERERWRKGRGFEEEGVERVGGFGGEEGGEGLEGQGWWRSSSSHGHGTREGARKRRASKY